MKRNSISNEKSLLCKLNTEFVTRYVKTDSAITLVALVVTIIILLILTAVTLNLITGTDGIIDKAVAALIETESAEAREYAELFFSDCKAGYFEERYIDKNNVSAHVPDYYRDQVGEKGRPIGDGYYVTMDDSDNVYIYSGDTEDAVNDLNKILIGNADENGVIDWGDLVKWDKKAAPEDVFIWKSDDPESPDYGTIIGYKTNLDNYPTLRFPSRCTRIIVSDIQGTYDEVEQIRSYTKNIREIELPNTVIEIGDSAFSSAWAKYYFESLEKITIPNSVTSIGDNAFFGCIKLTSISIPDSVTSIGNRVFYNCSGLTNVTIPNSVINLGNSVFNGCIKLTDVIIPEDITLIGEFTFYNCDGLTNIKIPESVTKIEGNAFQDCSNLVNITMSSNLTDIGGAAFAQCTSLTNIKIPDKVTRIGNSAFNQCTGLTSVTIPDSVESIGEEAFEKCTSLTSVTIPDTVLTIGWHAFYNVPHIYYNGPASGEPWGAKAMND